MPDKPIRDCTTSGHRGRGHIFKPASEGRRTSTTTPTTMSSLQSPGASGEAERDGCQPPAAPPAQPEKLELADALKARASRMFLRAAEDPIESGDPPIASAVTNDLVTAVRAAIRSLYEARRDDVCYSPERPDLKLSQEEAMGYLIADALGRPLLAPLDARPVGKRLDTRAGAVERQLAAMPRAAAEAARKAGAAAKKTGEPFDAKRHAAEHEASARSRELAKEYDPKLPLATVGRKRTAAVLEETSAALEETSSLPQMKVELQKAEAARAEAQALVSACAAAVDRAVKRRASLGPPPNEFGAILDRLQAEFVRGALDDDERLPFDAEYEAMETEAQKLADEARQPWVRADAAVFAAREELRASAAFNVERSGVAYNLSFRVWELEAEEDRQEQKWWMDCAWLTIRTREFEKKQLQADNDELRAENERLRKVSAWLCVPVTVRDMRDH